MPIKARSHITIFARCCLWLVWLGVGNNLINTPDLANPRGLNSYDEMETVAEWVWETVTDYEYEGADEHQADTDTKQGATSPDWLFCQELHSIVNDTFSTRRLTSLLLDDPVSPLLEIQTPPPDCTS